MYPNFYPNLNERQCPICGEIFFPTPYHVYKVKLNEGCVYLCKWTCLNRYREKLNKRKNR